MHTEPPHTSCPAWDIKHGRSHPRESTTQEQVTIHKSTEHPHRDHPDLVRQVIWHQGAELPTHPSWSFFNETASPSVYRRQLRVFLSGASFKRNQVLQKWLVNKDLTHNTDRRQKPQSEKFIYNIYNCAKCQSETKPNKKQCSQQGDEETSEGENKTQRLAKTRAAKLQNL